MILNFLKRIFFPASTESPTRFERDLVSLESKIKKASLYRESLKITHKRCKLFLILCYFGLFLGCLLHLLIGSGSSNYEQKTKVHFFTLGIAILGSFALGLVWKVLGFWYSKRIESYGSWISNLKRQHREKVEEFKVKSGYYQTKSLIERFDKSLGDGGEEEEKRASFPIESSFASTSINAFPAMNQENLPIAGRNDLPMAGRNEMPILSANEMPSLLTNVVSPIESRNVVSPIANQLPSPLSPPLLPSPLPRSRGWMDKIVDAVLGEIPEHYKYALICTACASHNGLCFPEELSTGKKFICASCRHMNDYKRESEKENEARIQANEGEKEMQELICEKEEQIHSTPLPEEQHSTLRKRKSRSKTSKRKDNSQTEKS